MGGNWARRIGILITGALLSAVPLWQTYGPQVSLQFHDSQMIADLKTLTSSAYEGRGLGEAGQVKTEQFLEGVFASKEIPYEKQLTDYIIPKWEKGKGLLLPNGKTLQAGKDLELWTDGPAGGLEWEGDILFAGTDFFKIPKALMQDKVVCVQVNRLSDMYLEAAIQAGAKGILYNSPGQMGSEGTGSVPDRKQMLVAHKTSSQLLVGELSDTAYSTLWDAAKDTRVAGYPYHTYAPEQGYYDYKLVGRIENVIADFPLIYVQTQVPTYIVTFKGKTSHMTTGFITQWEGQGSDAFGQTIYPAAQKSAVSTSVLLEFARALKIASAEQTLKHDVTLIFLGGASVHPRAAEQASQTIQKRYDTAQIMILEGLGGKETSGILLDWDRYSPLSRIFGSQVTGNLKLYPANFATGGVGIVSDFEVYKSFYRPNNGVITMTGLSDGTHFGNLNSPRDAFERIDPQKMRDALPILSGQIEKQVMGKMTFDFIKTQHLLWIGLMMLVVSVIGAFNDYCLASHSPERFKQIGRQPAWKVLSWAASSLPALLITLFFVGMILSLPQDFNVQHIGKATVSSVLAYDVLQNSWEGFMSLMTAFVSPNPALMAEIALYLKRSLILAGLGLLLSMSLGLIKGVTDAWLSKGKSTLGSILGIALYAVPDVLIAFIGLVSVVYLSKIDVLVAIVDANLLRQYIMPVIALSVVPMLYISRLVTVALEDEIQKDYVHYLYYKGMSRHQIYWKHFLIVGLQKLLASSKAVIMLMFSNLLVVEYLFNYPGVMTNILDSAGQPVKIILLSLSLGLSFGAFQLICRLLGQKLSPGRENL